MSVPGMQERTILLDGFSKTYAMTGWRMGYGVMRPDLAAHMTRLMTNSNSCTASFTQVAGSRRSAAIKSSVDHMRDEFQRRRDVFVAGLNKIKGFSCRMPKGAFYVFPNITQTGWKSKAAGRRAARAGRSRRALRHVIRRVRRRLSALQRSQLVENLRQALERLDQWTKKNLRPTGDTGVHRGTLWSSVSSVVNGLHYAEQKGPASQIQPPFMPGYGLPEGSKGLLPWSWAEQRLKKSQLLDHYRQA